MFGVARCDTTPAFEMQKCVFHEMPQLVEFFIIYPLFLAVLAWRYDGVHALILCLLNNGIAVIGFVGQKILGRYAFNQF